MGPYIIYHSKTEKTKLSYMTYSHGSIYHLSFKNRENKTFLHDFVKNINKLSYKNTLMGPLIFINYKIK